VVDSGIAPPSAAGAVGLSLEARCSGTPADDDSDAPRAPGILGRASNEKVTHMEGDATRPGPGERYDCLRDGDLSIACDALPQGMTQGATDAGRARRRFTLRRVASRRKRGTAPKQERLLTAVLPAHLPRTGTFTNKPSLRRQQATRRKMPRSARRKWRRPRACSTGSPPRREGQPRRWRLCSLAQHRRYHSPSPCGLLRRRSASPMPMTGVRAEVGRG
jgi:hypothetical protein